MKETVRNKTCLGILMFLLFIAAVSLLLTLAGRSHTSFKGGKVALVTIEGVLGVDVEDGTIIDELKEHRQDSSVKAVVIRINSPGGAVAPAQEIYDEVLKLREEKHVVASMGSVAASGGYYIAVAAERILANPGTMTGSIGVILEVPNIEELMGKVGVKAEVIKSGLHKDTASMFRSMTKEDRQLLQGLIDDVHLQFMEAVADNRNMTLGRVRELADGRVYTGRQAKTVGLVDEEGTLEDALELAAKMAGIEGEPEVVTRKRHLRLRDLLSGDALSLVGRFLSRRAVLPMVELKYLMSL